MKKWLLSLIAISAILTGCNEESKENTSNANTLTPVEVAFLTPTELEVGMEIELSAQVTQGDDYVDDANEVMFEVWESGMRDKGEMVDGQLTKDGIYTASYTFEHDGVYYMFAHTTARGMHTMPKQKMIVGHPDMNQVLEDDSSTSMDSMENHDKIEEMKTICWFCHKKATMNLRVDENKKPVRAGDQIQIGGNDRYYPVCRKCHSNPPL